MRTRKIKNDKMILGKYSFGVGDRFGHQGTAQLKALLKARNLGIELIPVWNKSNREHQIIGTKPEAVRLEAESAVKALGYEGAYFVDADHINLDTVDGFIESSDFFTLDVASHIGQRAKGKGQKAKDKGQRAKGKGQRAKGKGQKGEGRRQRAFDLLMGLGREVSIPGFEKPLQFDSADIEEFLNTYLAAVVAAVELYHYISQKKGDGKFVAEISMDEVSIPQSPKELLLILTLLGEFEIPVQTIAPKFSGRFNKGVDYVGDLGLFRAEFEADLLVIQYAVKNFGFPDNLKLSIHSGSDKFKIYPIIGELIRKYDMGIHVKTAGTTWLEEMIGLSMSGESGAALVRKIYKGALSRMNELCIPYADVIDIDKSKLPKDIDHWSGDKIAQTLRHIPDQPEYNMNMRQLIHVGYKLAAELGTEYTDMLKEYSDIIGQEVEDNIYDRHITRLFEKN